MVLYCGATPIFVEIAAKIKDNTKAIVAIYLFGLCANIDDNKNVAPDIPIIEDAACVGL